MWTVIFKYFISVECSANRYLHGIYTTKTTKAVTDFGCRNVDVVSRGLWITTVGWNLYGQDPLLCASMVRLLLCERQITPRRLSTPLPETSVL